MKAIIALFVAAITFIAGVFFTGSKLEPKPEVPSTGVSEESAVSVIKDAVSKFKNDLPEVFENLGKIESKEDLEAAEKEAVEFANKTLKEIQKKLPEDFKLELKEADLKKLSESKLKEIKKECEGSSKFNPDKIESGLTASGKGSLTANGKTYTAKGSAIILYIDGVWVIYDTDYELPKNLDINDIKEILKNF